MRIGYIGLGKLGLPVALSVARHHDVVGYDVSTAPAKILAAREYPHRELKAQDYLADTALRLASTVAEVVAHAEIVFVLVQTPHDPAFEGTQRLPADRRDFDYQYLAAAVREIVAAAEAQQKDLVLAVMSTVLPGTMAREIQPLLSPRTRLVYNPAFPAMGTAIPDFEAPEFVLLGVEDPGAAAIVRAFYESMITAPIVEMSVASAEATKVFYNSFISAKIALANAWMEVCHRLGANVDDVSRALCLATVRILSPKYMRGGMGDAGGCHPRDNIALSWLSRELGMGYDLFGDLMRIRERQAEWLAGLCMQHASRRGLPLLVLGKAYKSETNLTVGSCATLLCNILGESVMDVQQYDPHIDPPRTFTGPAAFVIGTDHAAFYDGRTVYPPGSVILDPWGKMPDVAGVEVVRVGRT